MSCFFSFNTKPPNILLFVLVTAITSTSLGVGILKLNQTAYDLLIYFSSVIILSKIMIFANIIYLNNTLETFIPARVKNTISVLYHGSVILYLRQKKIKKIFYNHNVSL